MTGSGPGAAEEASRRVSSWLTERQARPLELTPLPRDVSQRRYFRVVFEGGRSAIAAYYPAAILGECRRFLRTGEMLEAAGIRVPAVLAASCERGLMLLEDLGPVTLYERAGRSDELESYFRRAAEIAGVVASLPIREVADLNPPLGAGLLRRELRQTFEIFLQPRRLAGPAALAARLERGLDELCDRLAAEPPVPCHRDFMVRNLVPAGTPPELAVLDHQGLRLGPPAYDLASLFNDSLFLPREVESRILGDLGTSSSYHRAAAQRTLKAVGTYAAFARAGFDRHLHLIPRTLDRCLRHLGQCPETAPLCPELSRRWSDLGPEVEVLDCRGQRRPRRS